MTSCPSVAELSRSMQIMSVAKLSSLSYLSVAGVTSGQSVAELSRSMQVMVQQTPVQIRPLGRKIVPEEGVPIVLFKGENWTESQPKLHKEKCGVRVMVPSMSGGS